MAVDRKAMGQALAARTQESYASREGDRMFTGLFREDLEIKLWKIKEGNHWFDIIPYTSGELDPRHAPGTPCYVLEIYVHSNVGPRSQSFLCPDFNFKEPCPICEHRAQIRDQGPDGGPEKEEHDKLVKSLFPRRRVLYNVVVQDSEQTQAEGVQVLEAAHWNMEKHFVLLANRTRTQGEGAITFSDPDYGKRIVFTRTGSGATNTNYSGHAFEDREYTIPDEWLQSAHTLDELLYKPDYEEIATAFYGGAAPAQEEAPASAPRTAAPASRVPVGGSRVPTAAARPAAQGARPVPLRRTPAAPEPAEEELEEETLPEEEAPPPPPARKAKAPVPVGRVTTPAPANMTRVATAPAGGDQTCPEPTGTFGEDTDQFDRCQTCELWEPCAQAKTKAMAAARKASAAKTPTRR